jgi:hypothetical protein
MLTDEQAREIEHARKQGTSGPVLGKWVDELLRDRNERVQREQYIRARIRQALEYFETLIAGPPRSSRDRIPRGGTQR